MKFRIQHRLFLALLAASGLSVICMFFIMQWNIGRGFLQYINTVEQERFNRLSITLVQAYGEKGNWDFLKEDPANWLHLLVRTLPTEMIDPEMRKRFERRGERWEGPDRPPPNDLPPPPPHLERGFEARVFLLDENRNPVFGPPQSVTSVERNITPLSYQGKIVGFLGLLPRKQFSDAHQLRFVEQQQTAMAMVGGMILLLSALFSLPLTKRLLRPIKALAAGTHRLAGGDYITRVPVTSADELGQLACDFNALAFTLEKNEQARRQWVADISHELRTPLSVLRGEIEALEDGIHQTTPEALHSLHSEVLHLGHLVDDLYQLSLSDVGGLTYRKELVDPILLLKQVLDTCRAEFSQKKITLTVNLPMGLVAEVFADRERLHQLFENLLGNSLRHTDQEGELEIFYECLPGEVRMHFRDSAPGVPEKEMAKLFDRLFRVESSRNRSSGGAGLGLAICKNIVEAHEGMISAQPSPTGGLWITMILPLAGECR